MRLQLADPAQAEFLLRSTACVADAATTNPVTVRAGDTVAQALDLMLENNYSQLPVIDGRGAVLGLFSASSLIRGMASQSEARAILEGWVDEYLEPASHAAGDESLDVVLDRLTADQPLLVGTREQTYGLLTCVDALQHCYRLTQPYLLVRDIELALRDLISGCVPADQLGQTLARVLAKRPTTGRPGNRGTELLELQDLTFNEYQEIVCDKVNAEHFGKILGPRRSPFYGQLTKVREIRNTVMHFRSEPSLPDLDVLRHVRLNVRSKLQSLAGIAAA
jgi:CBS domain-containing protein